MNDTWILHGSKRQHHDTWSRLYEITKDWTAAWADNNGFHLETMPAAPTVTTHLWAWTAGRWLRTRIDPPHWWAAMLTAGEPPTGLSWKAETIQTPRINTILHWAPKEGRIQQYRGSKGVLDLSAIQLLVNRTTTAAFIGLPESLPDRFRPLLDAVDRQAVQTS